MKVLSCCLSSCSYIKPQHAMSPSFSQFVVYHLVPTSNHNLEEQQPYQVIVVYHLVPTSNHNILVILQRNVQLFIILFLHQTTTTGKTISTTVGCLSSCSYIKPQRLMRDYSLVTVVYHLVPTSNHNHDRRAGKHITLFIILFLHQTTTRYFVVQLLHGCLSSCSYIKPQHCY